MPVILFLAALFVVFIALPHDMKEMEHQEAVKKIHDKTLTVGEYNLLEDFEKKIFLENGGVIK